jgi:hypothetical protein
MRWRRSSSSQTVPPMLRGLLVISCILLLLLPVISITDDLSQLPTLAEGNRLQDVLKAPELRGIHVVSAILPAILLPFRPKSRIVARNFFSESPVPIQEIFWSPCIDKRPPPSLA